MSGCSWKARQLTEAENEVLVKLRDHQKKNREAVHGSLDDLMRISTEAFADQYSLDLSISKAKLLESMKSPWLKPRSSLVRTQMDVTLYHLYALSEAERELFDARLNLRQESIRETKKAYDRLLTLTNQIIESEKVILAHLNQPVNARISGFIDNVLVETKAFRETVAASDNPRLRSLAEDVEKAEERVERIKDLIDQALERILKSEER
jgi:hypothetical protein